ncbi:DUF3592 domain-containing protein [Nocardioides sp. AX2bis]|uniref:DUF3592 domain-containing protein n=1 Tax=Nocardioides sp. AX2bis TaxID=2653157 RepID=UPI0012F16BB1|nr:DUF3592 domain-containing protein [Nocardioides sp. AX2bis]VXC55629.1 exported hypothetical protein [Nocardioides sp. AX2bis]
MVLTIVLLVGGGAALTGALAGLSLSASTTGEVTDVEQRGDSTRVAQCDVSASYAVDGQELDVQQFRSEKCPEIGSAINVRYDPEYPPQAELGDLPTAPFVVAGGFVAGLLLTVVLLARDLLARRRSTTDGSAAPSASTARTGMYDEPPRP